MTNYTGKNYSVSKQGDMSQRAAAFDECVAELSPEAQIYIADLVQWIEDNMLVKGSGIKTAKEVVLQVIRFKENRGLG